MILSKGRKNRGIEEEEKAEGGWEEGRAEVRGKSGGDQGPKKLAAFSARGLR